MTSPETSEATDLAQKLRHNGAWVNWGFPHQHWAPLDEADRHAAADLIDRLTAAAQVRAQAAAQNCTHPRKTGTGFINSDGSSHSKWACPDCGSSGEWIGKPYATTP